MEAKSETKLKSRHKFTIIQSGTASNLSLSENYKQFAGYNFPIRVKEDKNIRLKLTSKCPWSCKFCHEEGSSEAADLSMKNVDEIIKFCKNTGRDRVHLTGGEPTRHPEIVKLVNTLSNNGLEVAITTNGQFSKSKLFELINAGAEDYTFSVATRSAVTFASMHKQKFTFKTAQLNIDRTQRHIELLKTNNIECDVNIPFSGENNETESLVLHFLDRSVKVNLFSIIGGKESYDEELVSFIKKLDLKPLFFERVANTSRGTFNFYYYPSKSILSVKVLLPHFLQSLCVECKLKANCAEYYYGLRVIQIGSECFIKPCLHIDKVIRLSKFTQNPIYKEIIKQK